MRIGCFNRRGDSLGGAAALMEKHIAGRLVSIAGAILWGVLRPILANLLPAFRRFNRRGDSLGGAARACGGRGL